MSAYSDRIKDEHRAQLSIAYSIGVLVHSAFNSPKKFPKAKDFIGGEKRVVKTLEEQRNILSRIAKKVG